MDTVEARAGLMHVAVVERTEHQRPTPPDDAPPISTLDDRGVFIDAEHPMSLGPRAGPGPPPVGGKRVEMRGDEDAGQQAERLPDRHPPRDGRPTKPVGKVEGVTAKHHRPGARTREDRAGAMPRDDRRPERRTRQRFHDVAGLAAGEVDPVRIRDRRGVPRILCVVAVQDHDPGRLGTERGEVSRALFDPRPRRVLESRRGRYDRDAGAARGDVGEDPAIDLSHRARELARAAQHERSARHADTTVWWNRLYIRS